MADDSTANGREPVARRDDPGSGMVTAKVRSTPALRDAFARFFQHASVRAGTESDAGGLSSFANTYASKLDAKALGDLNLGPLGLPET
ncbi:hypothetical protein DFH06DRAFT_1332820 [Mycena polygramma]|nr:hypothetical protein DFH06DRAFT_1332820 [Mycena polygramma]